MANGVGPRKVQLSEYRDGGVDLGSKVGLGHKQSLHSSKRGTEQACVKRDEHKGRNAVR